MNIVDTSSYNMFLKIIGTTPSCQTIEEVPTVQPLSKGKWVLRSSVVLPPPVKEEQKTYSSSSSSSSSSLESLTNDPWSGDSLVQMLTSSGVDTDYGVKCAKETLSHLERVIKEDKRHHQGPQTTKKRNRDKVVVPEEETKNKKRLSSTKKTTMHPTTTSSSSSSNMTMCSKTRARHLMHELAMANDKDLLLQDAKHKEKFETCLASLPSVLPSIPVDESTYDPFSNPLVIEQRVYVPSCLLEDPRVFLTRMEQPHIVKFKESYQTILQRDKRPLLHHPARLILQSMSCYCTNCLNYDTKLKKFIMNRKKDLLRWGLTEEQIAFIPFLVTGDSYRKACAYILLGFLFCPCCQACSSSRDQLPFDPKKEKTSFFICNHCTQQVDRNKLFCTALQMIDQGLALRQSVVHQIKTSTQVD